MPDSHTLDRIDVRYSVATRSTLPSPLGDIVAEASFLLTLGVYSGLCTPQIVADNVNARGIHGDDLTSVSGPVGGPTDDEVADMLETRGVLPEDIVSYTIDAVVLDDEDIAQSYSRLDS